MMPGLYRPLSKATLSTKASGGSTRRAAPAIGPEVALKSLVRQRIGPDLDVDGARIAALAGFHQPGRPVAVGAPQAAALPARIRIVDAAVEALGVEAHRIRDADHHHLAVLQRDETV